MSNTWSPDDIWPGEEESSGAGCPSKYKPEYAKTAQKLCKMGATDADLAFFFEVDIRTVERWRLVYPEFRRSSVVGKKEADDRVKRSLFQKATGFTYTEQEAYRLRDGPEQDRVEVVEVQRHVPPEFQSMKFWLLNRCKDEFRDRQEIEHTGEVTLSGRLDRARARAKDSGETGSQD